MSVSLLPDLRTALIVLMAIGVPNLLTDDAFAVRASPETVVCNGKCESCLELEVDNGVKRCTKCGVDPQCIAGDPGLSADVTTMLQAHNDYRQRHRVPALSWSSSLAKGAQDWASACTPDPKKPDRFAHSGFDHGYGENLFWGTRATSQQAADWWYAEIEKYDFDNPRVSYEAGDTDSSREVRHFTQVVWKGTTELGCGAATCGGVQYWVCRYQPQGNFNGQNPGVLEENVPRVGGGGAKSSTRKLKSNKLRPATVVQAVEVFDAPGGDGNKTGELVVNSDVTLVGPCQDDWCHVTGEAVPDGDGYVYNGDDYRSLSF